MMIALRLSAFLLSFVVFSALGQSEPSRDWRETQNVIEQQLAAFQRDDAEAAFFFASPNIRNLFRTSANFIAMVRSQYQAVYRPRSMNFLEPAVIEGSVLQPGSHAGAG